MSVSRAQRFSHANDLWFRQGHTARALKLYRELAAEDPTDPLVLFQLSRALWALDDFDEARRLAEQAAQHRDRLNADGRGRLDDWRARIAQPPQHARATDIELLDVEQLERTNAPPHLWHVVGLAAEGRELYGVAAQALARGYDPSDRDAVREIEHARLDAGLDRELLETMVDRPPRDAARSPTEATSTLPERSRRRDGRRASNVGATRQQHAPEDDRSRQPASAARPVVRPSAPTSPPPSSLLEPLPLTFDARVEPAVTPVGARVDLIVRLTNPLDEAVVVNRRFLLMPPGMEDLGELALHVSGPPGYRNEREIHVRAGRPGPEDFTKLKPGESAERAVSLWRYESLHLPGNYTLAIVYHNSMPFELEGQRALTGVATAQARLTRIADRLPR